MVKTCSAARDAPLFASTGSLLGREKLDSLLRRLPFDLRRVSFRMSICSFREFARFLYNLVGRFLSQTGHCCKWR